MAVLLYGRGRATSLSGYTPSEVQSVDVGTALKGPAAPAFTLTDQFGQPVSLAQFRGKAVILSFDDDECTTVCPLTTVSMTDALALLGPAASKVALVGINANPEHTTVSDVLRFSQLHGMNNRWDFLTGSPSQLQAVWKAYGIAVQIDAGAIDHTPAVYVLGPNGHERWVFLTSADYGVVPLEAEYLAKAVSAVLPGHPRVANPSDLAAGGSIASPASPVHLDALIPGSVGASLGGPGEHLVVFFASWSAGLTQGLTDLQTYAGQAASGGLPVPVAVDLAPTEPSLTDARAIRPIASGSLGFPVVVDPEGRVADAYGVRDIPWYVLVRGGKILWSNDGWLSASDLLAAVRAHAETGSSSS